MRFEEIVLKLTTEEIIQIASGAIQIKKKLREIIGGIPVYSFYIEFLKEKRDSMEFNSYHEMEEYSYISLENIFKRCSCCEEIPLEGYYFNNETNDVFCCYTCLVEWMNKEFGLGHWQLGTGDINKHKFYIEVDKELIDEFLPDCNYIKQDNRYFREYDIEMISQN